MSIFERRESEVRSYSRRWPTVFGRAAGSWLYGVDGMPYLDFFAGPAPSTTATTIPFSSGRSSATWSRTW